MKKHVFFKIASLFFIAGIIFLLPGCPSTDEDDNGSGSNNFLGTYSCVETCTYQNDSYEITITAGGSTNEVTIYNLYDWDENATATINGNNISIPSQVLDGITFSGTGSLSGNTLTISYTAEEDDVTDDCNLVCTKQ